METCIDYIDYEKAVVSTDEQNPQRQIDAFLAEGIDPRFIFVDKWTGNKGNLDKRPEYQRAKMIARKGDIIFLEGGTKDQASPHRHVCPWTNSVVFTTVTPTSLSFEIRNLRFAFLPTIEVNHL